MDLEPDNSFLVMAPLVDGTLRGRVADFQSEHCLVGPGAGLEKSPVRRGRDEDIVEARGRRARRRVDESVRHSEARGQVDPLAIVVRPEKLSVARVAGL